jgi:hypothetical protein
MKIRRQHVTHLPYYSQVQLLKIPSRISEGNPVHSQEAIIHMNSSESRLS